MKKLVVFLTLCLIIATPSVAQMEIDTLYYDNNWKGVESPTFASFYRIIAKPSDNNYAKRYRDYYITGELRAEGFYKKIEKYDDSKSVFDGDNVIYGRDGKILEKKTLVNGKLSGEYIENTNDGRPLLHCFYKDGVLDGEYIENTDDGKPILHCFYKNGKFDGEYYEYDDDGVLRVHCFYKNDELDGEYSMYDDDGLLYVHCFYKNGKLDGLYTEFSENAVEQIQMQYENGRIVDDCCVISNNEGLCSKVKFSTGELILESPSLSDMKVEYKDGKAWHYYTINGILIGISTGAVSSYGKYFEVSIVIANNTMFPFDLDTDLIVSSVGDKKGKSEELRVYSSDEYLKKVRRQQNFATALYAWGQNSAARSAGYSASTSRTNYRVRSSSGRSFGGTYSTTTVSYDGAAAYQAQLIASANISNFIYNNLAEREAKEEGYLKKNTINPGETISGYINIQRKNGKTIFIGIDIDGIIYPFEYDISQVKSGVMRVGQNVKGEIK